MTAITFLKEFTTFSENLTIQQNTVRWMSTTDPYVCSHSSHGGGGAQCTDPDICAAGHVKEVYGVYFGQ